MFTPFSTTLSKASPYGIDYSLRRAFNPTTGLAQRLAASTLRPNASGGSFPFDNVLNKLRGNARYLTRQAQTALMGVPGQANRAFTRLQGIGPTALNPLATRTPTTRLGKFGSSLNPLNPMNAGYAAGGILLDAGINYLPINETEKQKLKGFAQGLIYTPGGPAFKVLGGLIMHDFNNPAGPTNELANIEKYQKLYVQSIETGMLPGPEGPDPYLVNSQGQQWAGKKHGFKPPEVYNSLYPKAQTSLKDKTAVRPPLDRETLNETPVVQPPVVEPAVVVPKEPVDYNLLKEYENNLRELQGINTANLNLSGGLNTDVSVSQVVVPEVASPASPYATNVGDIPANELYEAARRFNGIDSQAVNDLGLALWAQQYQGRLAGATPELAGSLTQKANLVRALLDAQQQRLPMSSL